MPIRGAKCVLAEQQEISKNSHEATSNPYNRYKGVAPYFTHRVTCLGEIRKSKYLGKGFETRENVFEKSWRYSLEITCARGAAAVRGARARAC